MAIPLNARHDARNARSGLYAGALRQLGRFVRQYTGDGRVCRNDEGMATMAAQFLFANLPPLDPDMKIARGIVETIIKDREVTRIRHLVSRFNATERTLQRLFQRYVGASPRWVIKRYRAYEALDHLHDAQPLQLAALAQHLGYFDQAHFANDFKNNIGLAPSEYAEYALGLKVRASAGS
jgi:AraC-like DNA-binding protein